MSATLAPGPMEMSATRPRSAKPRTSRTIPILAKRFMPSTSSRGKVARRRSVRLLRGGAGGNDGTEAGGRCGIEAKEGAGAGAGAGAGTDATGGGGAGSRWKTGSGRGAGGGAGSGAMMGLLGAFSADDCANTGAGGNCWLAGTSNGAETGIACGTDGIGTGVAGGSSGFAIGSGCAVIRGATTGLASLADADWAGTETEGFSVTGRASWATSWRRRSSSARTVAISLRCSALACSSRSRVLPDFTRATIAITGIARTPPAIKRIMSSIFLSLYCQRNQFPILERAPRSSLQKFRNGFRGQRNSIGQAGSETMPASIPQERAAGIIRGSLRTGKGAWFSLWKSPESGFA